MTSSIKVTFQPDNITVTVPAGTSIKDTAILAGIQMDFPCGGQGTCGKCKVHLNQPERKIELACQTKLTSDSIINIPNALHTDRKKLVTTIRHHKYPLNPFVRKPSHNYGLAIDIGTTSVAGILTDLHTGQDLAMASTANAQSVFGADVVSRINYAITHKNGLSDLQGKIIGVVNRIIATLCRQASIKATDINDITLVGNTAMQHLLLGKDVRSLSIMPFEPSYKGAVNVRAKELGMPVNPDANIYVFPHIAGFVGGDTVGLILALGLHQTSKITLAIDIGTNGEIVLGSSAGLLCTSTAAGPAFEGVRITGGMRASAGAIESLRITDDGVKYHTIDNAPAAGICGSGLIDLLAELVRLRIIDETGKFVKALPNNLPITITQRDIRELQLAKSAIYAGTQIIQKRLDIKPEDIEHLYIAGTFGNYIDKKNAQIIGLIPKMPLEKVIFVGNAALEGARLALISQRARQEASGIANFAQFLNLSTDADFQDAFADAMSF